MDIGLFFDWLFRVDSGFLLHGCGIFFQFCGCCSAISHCSYHLAEILLAYISGCVNSRIAGLLGSVRFHISMGIQSNQVFYQICIWCIACKYKYAEGVICRIENGFFSGVFIFVADLSQRVVTLHIDNLCIG